MRFRNVQIRIAPRQINFNCSTKLFEAYLREDEMNKTYRVSWSASRGAWMVRRRRRVAKGKDIR
ncbi:hypothetical protein DIJ60_14850 [Burkholderia pseudomallei]|nr:hypothetical protein DIJ60_14850 [Burkholderia pseudomallei]